VTPSLIKNIFEEENKFDGGTRLFWKIVPNWVYFGLGEDFKLTTELSERAQYSRNQAIKNSITGAILIRIFIAQPVKIPHFKSLLLCKRAR